MNFKITFLYITLSLFNICTFQAQHKSKTLTTTTWYSNCDFKSDTLKLFPSNTKNLSYQVNFAPEGKMLLLNLRTKKTNTSYSYKIEKSSINIFYTSKDSLIDLDYLILINKKAKNVDLPNYYSMAYKKKQKLDVAPVNKFNLTRGSKTVAFDKMDEITVFRMKKGLKHDSIEIISKGTFQEIRSDTLILNAYQFSEHNFYKRYPDTNHYFSETLFDTLIQIKTPLNEITKIQAQREKLVSAVNTAALAALGVFFVSFPLAITVKSSDYGATFSQVAAISALSIPFIVSVNMLFSKQDFQIMPNEKNKKTWQLKYKK